MKNENSFQTFRTEDFYLATFLISNEVQLLSLDRENPKRCKFVFKANPRIENLVHSYNFSISDSKEILVDARKLINAIKDLKTKLYSGQ